MNLPPPNHGIKGKGFSFWKDHSIDTPTFQLTPVEKSDMSPFLIHMTGKTQIISILKGEEASNKNDNHGFLKSNLPLSKNNSYNQEMVCFTESPTFALDFFRHRKFDRWKQDQRYGIGFDKSAMIERNVRPVNYIQDDINKIIINVYNKIKNQEITFEDNKLLEKFTNLTDYLYKYSIQLSEYHPSQGFMWEREWRFSGEKGFEFSYENIKIICCPNEEKSEIIEILGNFNNQIEFVESWHEYSVVTQFLKDKNNTQTSKQENPQEQQNITLLTKKIKEQKLHISILRSFNDHLESLIKEKTKTEEEIKNADVDLQKLEEDLSKLKAQESDQKQVKSRRRRSVSPPPFLSEKDLDEIPF